jgi:hypothetical protein
LQNRFKDFHVSGATAQIAGQTHANLTLGWIWNSLKKIHRRQNHSGCADAALRAATFKERLLNAMKLLAIGDSFYRRYLFAIGLKRRQKAAVYKFSVQQDTACATFPFAAAFFCPRQMQFVAEHIQQTSHGMGAKADLLSIDGARDIHPAFRIRHACPPALPSRLRA